MPNNLLQKARELRMKAYHDMLLLDGQNAAYLDDQQALWNWTDQTIDALFAVTGRTPEEEGEYCLSILVGLNIGIRHDDKVHRAVQRAEHVLPRISDDKLRCHLLVYLYAETEDEALQADICRLMDQWPADTLTQEDHYLQQVFQTIEETTPYGILMESSL